MAGRVEGIYIAAEHGESPEPVDSVRALAGRGLEGNRYFFDEAAPGTALTLIAAEAVEAMEREHGISIEPRESRRNVVTRESTSTSSWASASVSATWNVTALRCASRARACRP
jgi:hypothetical protein